MPVYTSGDCLKIAQKKKKALNNKVVTKIKTIQGYMVWWYIPIISTFERWSQKDGDFEAIWTLKPHTQSQKSQTKKKPNQTILE